MERMTVRQASLIGKPAQSRRRLGFYAVLAVATLLPLSIDAVTGNALTTASLMSADGLWTLALVRDILGGGGHLADWNLAQHADLFPDKLLAAIAYAVSRRPEIFLFVFETLNLALYFAIAWYCLRLHLRATSGYAAVWGIALWGALLVSALPPFLRSWGIFDTYSRYIGGPAHHFGPYFCAILAAFIAIDCVQRPLNGRTIRRLAVSCLLMLLCALSDKLTILVAVPGFLVAVLYVAAVRRSLSPVLLVCGASMCAAAAVAYLFGDPLWNRITEITPAKPNVDPVHMKQEVRFLLQSLLNRLNAAGDIESVGVIVPQRHHWNGISDLVTHLDLVQAAISGVAILSAFSLAILYIGRAASALWRRASVSPAHATADAFIVYLVASVFLLPAGLIAAGVIYSYGVELYLYAAGYCILWAVAAKLSERIPPALPRPQLAFGIAATGLLLSAAPVNVSAPPFQRAPKPPLVRCLEEFGKTRDLRLGLGSHLDTYPVEFLSEGRIVVRSIAGAAELSHWTNSNEWYAPRTDGRLFTFVITSEYIDERGLRERVGDPAEVLDCASLGRGFSDREIFYYDHSGAERLTARINEQYRQSKRR